MRFVFASLSVVFLLSCRPFPVKALSLNLASGADSNEYRSKEGRQKQKVFFDFIRPDVAGFQEVDLNVSRSGKGVNVVNLITSVEPLSVDDRYNIVITKGNNGTTVFGAAIPWDKTDICKDYPCDNIDLDGASYTGNAIFLSKKFTVYDAKIFAFPQPQEWHETSRFALIVTACMNGLCYSFVCVHLSVYGPNPRQLRAIQLANIVELVKFINNPRTIVLGDFNAFVEEVSLLKGANLKYAGRKDNTVDQIWIDNHFNLLFSENNATNGVSDHEDYPLIEVYDEN